MQENVKPIDIVQAALGSLDHRKSFTPGMFEPLKPLFRELGYTAAAVYIVDDYPDRMFRVSAHGDEERFPPVVALGGRRTPRDELTAQLPGLSGLLAERLFSHGRELGAIAAVAGDGAEAGRAAFAMLAKSVSVMAYVERVRNNAARERQEREVFFAQSLTSRLLIREAPKMRRLRLGFEFVRDLGAGGDFFDFIPERDGSLFGFIGCCNGRGLRTVLEVTGIMRHIHRAAHDARSLSEIIATVNEHLVREKRRAHQASLALFHINPAARLLRVAKSGRVALLRCGRDGETETVPAPGTLFLGMLDKPEIAQGEFEFRPGQALFCATEGFCSAGGGGEGRGGPDLWLRERVAAAMAEPERTTPLAGAVLDAAKRSDDGLFRPDGPLLTLSAEFVQTGTD